MFMTTEFLLEVVRKFQNSLKNARHSVNMLKSINMKFENCKLYGLC